MFLLPDVASASIAGVELVQVVVSVTFTVGEDEANTAGFQWQILGVNSLKHWKLYCLTNNTLPFFITYNIYILNVLIYIHIC